MFHNWMNKDKYIIATCFSICVTAAADMKANHIPIADSIVLTLAMIILSYGLLRERYECWKLIRSNKG